MCAFASHVVYVVHLFDFTLIYAAIGDDVALNDNVALTSGLLYIYGAERFPGASNESFWAHVPGLLAESSPIDNALRILVP